MAFPDRTHAGHRLAERGAGSGLVGPMVRALPSRGVSVAAVDRAPRSPPLVRRVSQTSDEELLELLDWNRISAEAARRSA